MEDNTNGSPPERPESLLPYDSWSEEASRHVVVKALAHAAAEGLPGEHHFFISFRTDGQGVSIPPRLRAQYPHEMTIVLQHQFWDLTVDPADGMFSVGLSFGGVPATLIIPFAAITAFADPHVQFGLRFHPPGEEVANDQPAGLLAAPPAEETPPPSEEAEIVSLDAFRKRPPSKDQ